MRSFPVGYVLVAYSLLGALGVAPAPAQRAIPVSLAWDEVIQGEDQDRLRWPVAVAAMPSGEVAVADAWDSRLLIFEELPGGWVLSRSVTLPGIPRDLVHTGEHLLVSLGREAALISVEGEGLALRQHSLPDGVVPGELAAALGGGFQVFDRAAGRVLRFDSAGRAEMDTRLGTHVSALALSPDGGFFAAIPHLAEIRRYGPNGQLVTTLSIKSVGQAPVWPAGMVLKPGGNLILSDRHAGTLLEVDSTGALVGTGSRRGWDPGLMRFPGGMTQLLDGRIAAVDQGNGRVQLFRATREVPLP